MNVYNAKNIPKQKHTFHSLIAPCSNLYISHTVGNTCFYINLFTSFAYSLLLQRRINQPSLPVITRCRERKGFVFQEKINYTKFAKMRANKIITFQKGAVKLITYFRCLFRPHSICYLSLIFTIEICFRTFFPTPSFVVLFFRQQEDDAQISQRDNPLRVRLTRFFRMLMTRQLS